jgi:hypothetical protein
VSAAQKPFQFEIETALRLLHAEGTTFEVRVPETRQGTMAGYFRDHATAARQVVDLVDGRAPAVYVTLNPVHPDAWARAAERIKPRMKTLTGDREVTRRRWLLLDFDTKRLAGISSTEEEHAAALARAAHAASDLREIMGWSDPIRADSGNGGHLLYPIDLPNDSDSTELVNRVLRALANYWDDDEGEPIRVCLDTTVGNAARISKLYGTIAGKGDSVPDRPHRRAKVLGVPESRQVVTREQLEELCDAFGMPKGESQRQAKSEPGRKGSRHIEDFGAYLREHGIGFKDRGVHPDTCVHRYQLDACAWAGHTDHAAAAFQFPSGSIATWCSHNSCRGKGLREFRDAVEPGWDGGPRARQEAHREESEESEERPMDRSGDTSHTSLSSQPKLRPPEKMDLAAYHGLAGDIVTAIEPHTEADPVAILAQFLTVFGNVVGRHAYFRAEQDRHYPNLFSVLIGDTSKGRKGTSYGQAIESFRGIQADYLSEHVINGLSSGEGLIHAVRDYDPTEAADGKKQKVILPPTILQQDKRLLVRESEFATVLKMFARDGNTLSTTLREAWDGEVLGTLTKNAPERATGAHVSIIGHITKDELRRYLSETEQANGLGNRFLWFYVRRSQLLPDGGDLDSVDFAPLQTRLRLAIEFAQRLDNHVLTRDPQARSRWHEVYGRLSEGMPGLFGAMTARAEAQVMRLASNYALLDCSKLIRVDHLDAALAIWRYAEDSVRYVFGDALGDPVGDTLLRKLRDSKDGMTRWDITNALGRHVKSDAIDRALDLLADRDLAYCEEVQTGGRPSTVWHAVQTPQSAKKAKEGLAA